MQRILSNERFIAFVWKEVNLCLEIKTIIKTTIKAIAKTTTKTIAKTTTKTIAKTTTKAIAKTTTKTIAKTTTKTIAKTTIKIIIISPAKDNKTASKSSKINLITIHKINHKTKDKIYIINALNPSMISWRDLYYIKD